MKRLAAIAVLAAAPIFAVAQQGPTEQQLRERLALNYFRLMVKADKAVAERCGQFGGLAGASFNLMRQGRSKRDVAVLAIPVGERYGIELGVSLLAVDIAESAMLSSRAQEIHAHEVERMAFGFCIGAESNERGHSAPKKRGLPYSGKGVQS